MPTCRDMSELVTDYHGARDVVPDPLRHVAAPVPLRGMPAVFRPDATDGACCLEAVGPARRRKGTEEGVLAAARGQRQRDP